MQLLLNAFCDSIFCNFNICMEQEYFEEKFVKQNEAIKQFIIFFDVRY